MSTEYERARERIAAALESQPAELTEETTVNQRKRKAADLIPSKVIVTSCGIDVVEGVYQQAGLFQDAPKYVKTDIWDGEEQNFTMFRYGSCNEQVYWYLSIVPHNGIPGTHCNTDFYSADVDEENPRIPPKEGWIVYPEGESQGLHPPPTLSFDEAFGEDVLCPISLELPFDPVMADDGNVYERSEIEKHFAGLRKDRKGPRSPLTNESMSAKLVPCHQIKNLIQSAILNGHIIGELAKTWNEKAAVQKAIDDLLRKAERGHVASMVRAAENYLLERDGFKKDAESAFKWFKKAHLGGNVHGTAQIGSLLVQGIGTKKNCTEGLLYISIAAAQGSDLGAYMLGMAFAKNLYYMRLVDTKQAIFWLEKSLSPSCTTDYLLNAQKAEIRQKVEELKNRVAAT